jgi:hypothetical protein
MSGSMSTLTAEHLQPNLVSYYIIIPFVDYLLWLFEFNEVSKELLIK